MTDNGKELVPLAKLTAQERIIRMITPGPKPFGYVLGIMFKETEAAGKPITDEPVTHTVCDMLTANEIRLTPNQLLALPEAPTHVPTTVQVHGAPDISQGGTPLSF